MEKNVGDHVYALLLRAYPKSYRSRFGPSMFADFQDRYREVQRNGNIKVIVFLVSTFVDVVRLAPAEHLRQLTRSLPSRRNHRKQRVSVFSKAVAGFRIAMRTAAKNPLSSVIAIVTIAFGIGLSVTTFSIVYGATMRGLPFEQSDQLVHFERQNLEAGLEHMAVTPHDYIEWKTQQQSFEDLAAFVEVQILLRDAVGNPRPEIGVRIDTEAFALLRVQPMLGRVFTDEENRPGGPKVILLSHALWQSAYGADSSIVGRSIRVTDQTTEQHTIVGVMPPGFGFPIAEQFWLPLRVDLGQAVRGRGRLDVFGRLAPHVSIADARQEFRVISERLAHAHADTNAGVEATLSTFHDEYIGQDFTSRVRLMLAGALFVLLIACANVSNLLMIRTIRRTKEIALRTALGASRSSVTLLILAEAAIIAFLGGVLGVGLAIVGVNRVGSALLEAGAVRLPHGAHAVFWWQFEVGLVPVLFALTLIGACVAVAGLVPALLAARADVGTLLKDESRTAGSPRLRKIGYALVSLEVALAAGLLTATVLTTKSLWEIQSIDLGFPSDDIVVARVGLYGEEYENNSANRRRYWTALLNTARQLPGVSNVAVSSSLPMLRHAPVPIVFPGQTNDNDEFVRRAVVSPGFFHTFGLSAVTGRLFTEQESDTDALVTVVNQSFVTKYFDVRDPLGHTVVLGRDDATEERIIVGVVRDSWMDGERNQDRAGLFVPVSSQTPLGFFLSIRTNAMGGNTASQIAGLANRVDPDQPIYRIRTMQNLIEERTGRFRLYGTFYVIFGVTALIMALMGLYGVISFNVGQRTNEIGIRVALGADHFTILASVLRLGLQQVAVGLAIGTALAYWISIGLESVLFQVEPWDPKAFLLVTTLLAATSVIACAIPARRAARVSPLTSLRDI